MTTQHTPGPWTATSQGFITADERNIARAFDVSNDYKPIPEAAANARLLAAAPDLLIALQACLHRLDAHDDQSAPECLAARAVIAKATGAA